MNFKQDLRININRPGFFSKLKKKSRIFSIHIFFYKYDARFQMLIFGLLCLKLGLSGERKKGGIYYSSGGFFFLRPPFLIWSWGLHSVRASALIDPPAPLNRLFVKRCCDMAIVPTTCTSGLLLLLFTSNTTKKINSERLVSIPSRSCYKNKCLGMMPTNRLQCSTRGRGPNILHSGLKQN